MVGNVLVPPAGVLSTYEKHAFKRNPSEAA
jgi:hypothetical protein